MIQVQIANRMKISSQEDQEDRNKIKPNIMAQIANAKYETGNIQVISF